MCLVDANETVGHLEHVVPQGDDDELSILGLFLKRCGKDDGYNRSVFISSVTDGDFTEQSVIVTFIFSILLMIAHFFRLALNLV